MLKEELCSTISTSRNPSRIFSSHLMDSAFPTSTHMFSSSHLCRYIAATHGAHIQVWRTPNHLIREFAPFTLHRTYTGHHDDVLSIQWSPDSQYVVIRFFSSHAYLTENQMFHHNLERYDCQTLHSKSTRGFPTKNICGS